MYNNFLNHLKEADLFGSPDTMDLQRRKAKKKLRQEILFRSFKVGDIVRIVETPLEEDYGKIARIVGLEKRRLLGNQIEYAVSLSSSRTSNAAEEEVEPDQIEKVSNSRAVELKEDLFAAPSNDEVEHRAKVRKAQVVKAGVTPDTITEVAPNILRSSSAGRNPSFVVGWVTGFGVEAKTRIKSFPTRAEAKHFQKQLITQIVSIDEAENLKRL